LVGWSVGPLVCPHNEILVKSAYFENWLCGNCFAPGVWSNLLVLVGALCLIDVNAQICKWIEFAASNNSSDEKKTCLKPSCAGVEERKCRGLPGIVGGLGGLMGLRATQGPT